MALARLIILMFLTFYSYQNLHSFSLNHMQDNVNTVIFFSTAASLYFYPAIEAYISKRNDFIEIWKLNFFTGWTFIGWFILFIKTVEARGADKSETCQQKELTQNTLNHKDNDYITNGNDAPLHKLIAQLERDIDSLNATDNVEFTQGETNTGKYNGKHITAEQAHFLAEHPYIPKEFIALDVETTGLNAKNDRIIEIAAIKFNILSNEHQVFEALINPGIPVPGLISNLTGITNQMLADKESFKSIAQDLHTFIGDLPIVAYNASFDKGFIVEEFERVGIKLPNHFHCAMKLSKQAFKLSSYKLIAVAKHCNVALKQAHRATDDAAAAGQVFMCAAVALGHINENGNSYTAKESSRITVNHNTYTPNESGVNFGKHIVFTGQLALPRSKAFSMAADAGFTIKNNVSRKTHYLVLGDQDKTLVGSDGISTKQRKAQELIDSGFKIHIIGEADFISLCRS